MNRRQRQRKHLRRVAHPRSILRARTERRYRAEQAGLTCIKACVGWFPMRSAMSTCGVCGRKLKKARTRDAVSA
jgi:hypothetical protein